MCTWYRNHDKLVCIRFVFLSAVNWQTTKTRCPTHQTALKLLWRFFQRFSFFLFFLNQKPTAGMKINKKKKKSTSHSEWINLIDSDTQYRHVLLSLWSNIFSLAKKKITIPISKIPSCLNYFLFLSLFEIACGK